MIHVLDNNDDHKGGLPMGSNIKEDAWRAEISAAWHIRRTIKDLLQEHRYDKKLPEGKEWSWRIRTIELNIQRALTAHPLCFGVETYVNKLMEQVIPDVRKFLEREAEDVPDSLKEVEWEAFVQKLKDLISRLDAFIKRLLEKIRVNEVTEDK